MSEHIEQIQVLQLLCCFHNKATVFSAQEHRDSKISSFVSILLPTLMHPKSCGLNIKQPKLCFKYLASSFENMRKNCTNV